LKENGESTLHIVSVVLDGGAGGQLEIGLELALREVVQVRTPHESLSSPGLLLLRTTNRRESGLIVLANAGLEVRPVDLEQLVLVWRLDLCGQF